MKLELRDIKDRNTTEERIVLIANEDCNLGYFFIFSTKKVSDGKISTLIKDPFWMPNKDLKKGDLVVIYTKKGTSSFKVNTDKTTSYFYYRNQTPPILIGDDIVLIVEASTWKAGTT